MKRHNFDAFSLVFGIGFAAVGATFLFGEPDISTWGAENVWPFIAIFVGLLVLAAAWRRRPTDPNGHGSDEPSDDA
jgi:hypothetical protein